MHKEIGMMTRRFLELMNSGEMTEDPKTAEEIYANARISELNGDFRTAREHYEAYLQTKSECLDPHLRYLQMIEPQKGKKAAREHYLNLTSGSKSITSELVAILFHEHEKRIELLQKFLNRNPEVGPAVYFLGRQYSEAEITPRSLADRKREQGYLESFNQLNDKGMIKSWFMEPTYVDSWCDDVQQRLAMVASLAPSFRSPVTMRWRMHSRGWTGSIRVAEIATEIFWKRSEDKELQSTGIQPNRWYGTGQPQPKSDFEIPKFNQRTQFEIHYKDLNGEMMGPFTFEVDPTIEDIDACKELLKITRSGWVSFRTDDDQLFLHFTHLLQHKRALKTVRYGLNGGNVDRELPLASTKGTGIAAFDDKMPVFVGVPTDTKEVAIELEFKDGDKTVGVVNRPVYFDNLSL